MADPAGSNYVQLVNRNTGTCLDSNSLANGHETEVLPCASGDPITDTQLWMIRRAPTPAPIFAIYTKSRDLGQPLAWNETPSDSTPPSFSSSLNPYWTVYGQKNGLGPQVPTGGSVPTWTAPAQTDALSAGLLSSGDLDRAVDATGSYHDEAALVYRRASGIPTLTVLDYADPLYRVTASSTVLSLPNLDTVVGLAVGDFDGDGLNEIAVAWTDAEGGCRSGSTATDWTPITIGCWQR